MLEGTFESSRHISSHASYLIAPLTSTGTVKNMLCTYFNYVVQSGPKIKREHTKDLVKILD